ncbi:dipeptidase [Falseniella ignava]
MKSYITDSIKKDFVQNLKVLISYPSVLNEGENNTPFGQAIQDALEKTLDICRELGFRTYIDPQGYYGYAEVGEGELLAILCHLDVVPAGDLADWQTPPFEATVKEGSLYGRGAQDDKGPSLAALYAVKSLLDQGIQFKKRVRFIFGTDEETLWRCMARYNTIEEQASMGFAPDSSFPLTYAEKGLLQVKLHGPGSDQLELEVGGAFNVVPDKANYQGPLYNQVCAGLKEAGYDYQTTDQTVTVLGVPKHAKDASQGVNAVIRLATILAQLQEHPALSFLATQAGQDGTGSQIFGDIVDEPSGHLSFNVAGLMINHERSEIRIDIRIPVLADKAQLVAQLTKCAQDYQLRYEEFDYLAPLYVAKDSKLVSTLMQIYQEKTGDNSPALSSGGATFARTMQNCVAFGALFPGAVQTEHQANECAVLEDLYRAMDIYAEAVYRLAT